MMDAVPEPIMGNRMLGKHVSLRGLGDLGKEKPKAAQKKGQVNPGRCKSIPSFWTNNILMYRKQ